MPIRNFVCAWARDFARNGKIIFQRNCNSLYLIGQFLHVINDLGGARYPAVPDVIRALTMNSIKVAKVRGQATPDYGGLLDIGSP